MSDELTPDERQVRALTRSTLELELAFRASAYERDKMIVELYDTGRATQNGIARAIRKHWTRVYQIEAELKALDT
jgi:post-segregation antitoxin (ccd killing protein)